MSNRKYFNTTLVSITFGESLVSSGIDYSVIGSRPSLLENRNNKKFLLTAQIFSQTQIGNKTKLPAGLM